MAATTPGRSPFDVGPTSFGPISAATAAGPSRSSRPSMAARDARAVSESAAVRVSASNRPLTRPRNRRNRANAA